MRPFPLLFLFLFSMLVLGGAVRGQESLGIGAAAAKETEGKTVPLDAKPDEKIQRRLSRVLSKIGELRGVNVTVEDGMVTLTGIAGQGAAKERAAEIARRLEGVVFVDNQIERDTGLQGRILPALRKLQALGWTALRMAPVILLAVVIVGAGAVLARFLARWDAPWNLLGVSPLIRALIQRLLFTLALIGVILIALDLLDVTAVAGALLGAAGLAGVAIGFAFRDIAENYLAGILLSLRHPFTLGDLLQIDSHLGKVVRLNSRELILLTNDGNHVRIPNSLVFKSVMVNYTQNPRRRFTFAVGIGTDEAVGQALTVAGEAMAACRGVLREPRPFALVEALGDSSVTIHCHGWMQQEESDFFKTRSAAIQSVKTALEAAGIEMPEPIHQIRLRRPAAETRGKDPARDAPAGADVPMHDVSPNRELDGQIAEELEKSDEPNALQNERESASARGH